MTQRPTLSFWQIWNMSFGFLGIQFGFALQGGFMSRIFQTLGAEKDALPLLWIAAPLTGLLVQPIIGYLSDRTWHPWLGRRRPYFLIGAILSSLALLAKLPGLYRGRHVADPDVRSLRGKRIELEAGADPTGSGEPVEPERRQHG